MHPPPAAAPLALGVWEIQNPPPAPGVPASTALSRPELPGVSACRVQVGDQLETVFLLSGNDPAIHLYKEVRPMGLAVEWVWPLVGVAIVGMAVMWVWPWSGGRG